MINAAHVARHLFSSVCQTDGGGGDDQVTSRSDLRDFAHLRLGASVGTLLRLTPNADVGESETPDDGTTEMVRLHPLLMQVLLRSFSKANHHTPENNNQGADNANGRKVILASYVGLVGGTGWLERLDAKEVNMMEGNDCQAEIRLAYMCSSTSRGRSYFSSANRMSNNDREEGMSLLKQSLVGEVIAEGGIIGVNISQSEGVHAPSEIDCGEECGEDERRDVAFFLVTKIAFSGGASSYQRNERYLQLWPPDRFEICLDDDQPGNAAKEPQRTIQSDVREKDVNCYCPGYESVLEELLALAKMDDPAGAPTAVVLSGCSGVGKSRMASWLARELSHDACAFTASSISAKDILLEEASSSFDPSKFLDQTNISRRLLIIDDLDAIVGSDEEGESFVDSSLESEQLRALNAIAKLLDGAIEADSSRFFILGMARASWAQLPLQLARVGRFEKVVTMSQPTLSQRRDVFQFWLATLPLHNNATAVQWAELLAQRTAGCVAADIRRICADALTKATARVHRTSVNDSGEHTECRVEWDDVKEAARACVPSQLSSMDVIPASLSDHTHDAGALLDSKTEFELAWQGFGGYESEKKRLYRTVVRPWKYHILETSSLSHQPESGAEVSSIEATLGVSKPSGVLFHGPPGCGKTFAAMCLASSLGLHCVKVRASEVFNQWLGGSEATLRSIFSRARAASPCILFFDELDSLATNREGGDSDATSGVQSRILTTLLNEMDGITNAGGKQGILVVAATNRLDAIDAALLRPGRLEEHVRVGLPDRKGIQGILTIQTAKVPLDASVDFTELSQRLEASRASCAEVEGICRDACLIAMRRCSENEDLEDLSATSSDLEQAFRRIKNDPPK